MPFWKKNRGSKEIKPSESSTAAIRTTRQELPDNPLPYRPKPENPFRSRGDEHFGQGNYEGAVFMYEEAIRQDENDVLLLLQLALARTMCTAPQLTEAMQNVNYAIQLDTFNGQAWRLKGNIHAMLGDLDAAEEALVQAIGLLRGLEQFQASQSLSDIRTRRLSSSPTIGNIPVVPSVISPVVAPAVAPAVQPSQPQTIPRRELPADSQAFSPPSDSSNLSPVTPPTSPPSIVVNTLPSRQNTQTNRNPFPPQPRTSSGNDSSTNNRNSLLEPPLSPANVAAGLQSPTTSSAQPVRPITPNVYTQGEVLAQQLDIPTEAPPSYSTVPDVLLPRTAGRATSSNDILSFETTMKAKQQGALYLRPWTMEGQIDSVQLLFHGRTYLESVVLDLPPVQTLHTSWKKYQVSALSHPGTNFIDYDCESTISYEGNHLGTTTVLGYAEEYREHQLALLPLLNLTLEAPVIPPIVETSKIVQRIQLLRSNPTLEDNKGLSELIGLPPAMALNTTKHMIEDICMVLNRSFHAEPARFPDFLKVSSFSIHMFGSGVGLRNFLFLILLGAELAIRLIKMGTLQKHTNFMTTSASALVVVATQWMESVTVRSQLNNRYVLIADFHTSQSEGLLKFAENIGWPYMDEARREIQGLYTALIANPANVHNYLKDWLYGLVLPGKFFRHRIMSSLVLASPTTKQLSFAPYLECGLVVGGRSYWPKRTVLGRVLGVLRNPKSTCGWIGPMPAPIGFSSNWILLHARHVDFVTPVVDDLTQTSLEIFGFSETDFALDPQGLAREITDMSNWNPPTKLPDRPGSNDSTSGANSSVSSVRLSAIRLTEVVVASSAASYHRASLEFSVYGATVSFTLYANPVFVHVPKCVGSQHPIHKRQVKELFKNVILGKDLKPSTTWAADKLMIIDASENGEEAMARAWCAEKGRHAVVRKAGIGCFTCATNLTAKRTGLGFNVLIWSN